MKLGHFSISLAVKDIHASLEFYKKLGFEQIGGDPAQNWVVLDNDGSTIGLFQGMFDKNCLTFNPGWGPRAAELEAFDDVREIQAKLDESGIELKERADAATTGPAYITMVDPDGNPILIDQHR